MHRWALTVLALIVAVAAAAEWRDRAGKETALQASTSVSVASVTTEPMAAINSADAFASPLDCPVGSVPLLDIATFPKGTEHGGASPAAAFWSLYPDTATVVMRPFGQFADAPVWITSGDRSFVATILPDRSWFISPARFVRCQAMPTER